MDSSQDLTENDKDVLAPEVDESLGEPAKAEEGQPSEVGRENTTDPLYVQKRLKQQKRAHDRELREMHARIAELQNQVSPNNQQNDASAYSGNAQPQQFGQPGMDETIQKAVGFALQHRDMEERKAKEAQAQAELAKQYQSMQRHLDQTSDKYDDFDQVVRESHLPFTPTIRDAALLLGSEGAGSAGEVLYKLGKNPQELERISKLLPHQQAAEVIALGKALERGSNEKGSSQPKSLGTIKANPVVNSAGINDKTPPSAIRALMKAGKFK